MNILIVEQEICRESRNVIIKDLEDLENDIRL